MPLMGELQFITPLQIQIQLHRSYSLILLQYHKVAQALFTPNMASIYFYFILYSILFC